LDLQISRKLKVASGVLCLNESHINPNTLITGHEDKKIRIWDMEKGVVRKELQTNNNPVRAMLTVENPFSPDIENNFHLISFGNSREDVYFNQPEQNNAF
jgi:WD40 repeat protein